MSTKFSQQKITLTCAQDTSFNEIRLDKYLFKHFPEYSRSYFQQLIDLQKVFVNRKTALKSNYIVKKHDTIDVNFTHTHEFSLTPQDVSFEIIDQQEDFIIINKPAGLVVHNSANNPTEISLVHGLLHKFQDLSQFTETERPGIVHRIDRDTSGLLIIAKNQPAQIYFTNMFKNRSVQKTYLAIVHGHPPVKGKIDYPIGRHPIKGHKMSHIGIGSKPALTHYNVLAYYKNAALVAVNIVTGRTHQIRVHFSALGHGLLGDDLYGRKSSFINRQALHAWKLSFIFKGKPFSYSCIPPQDFTSLLKNLNAENKL